MADPYTSSPFPSPASPPASYGGFIPDWSEFWQAASYFFGAQQGQQRPIPQGFHVPYGADPISGVLDDMSTPLLRGSRSFVYGTDEEAFGRGVSNVIGNLLATLKLNPTPNQMKTIKKAADMLATWGPAALNIAEQLVAQDTDAGIAQSIVQGLRKGIDGLYGPGGPRVPMYSVLESLGEHIPIDQRDSMLTNVMHEVAPVNGELAGGYSYRQGASILAAAASMGYNVMNNVDTDIAKEIAQYQFNDIVSTVDTTKDDGGLLWTQHDRLSRISEQVANRKFSALYDASNFYQSLNKSIVNGSYTDKEKAERLAAGQQFTTFLNVTSKIKGIGAYKGARLRTFSDVLSLRSEIENLERATTDTKRKDYYTSILNDMSAIEKGVGEDYRGMDIEEELDAAERLQRQEVTEVVKNIGLYADDAISQSDFVEATILRDKLSSYGITHLDALAEDDKWKEHLKGANADLTDALNRYFDKDTGLHKTYTKAKENIQDADLKHKFELMEKFRDMSPAEQEAAMDNPEYAEILQGLTDQGVGAQVGQNYRALLKSTSILETALASTGTPIADKRQLMDFVNKVTYGGIGNMSAESLTRTIEQIGSGMMDSGASGNDLMQMAGKGAQSALEIGGNAQAGAIQAMKAGLAARAVAKTMHMDPSKAQELAARAAGRSNKSLVEKTYNAVGAFLDNYGGETDNPKYAALIDKIRHNENLSADELDMLYRESSQIMSSIGMTADQQHYYLNDEYSGGVGADAASRAGTSWMLFSTKSRDIMQDNIQRRLTSELSDLDENTRKDISTAITDTFGELDNIELLTNRDMQQEYKDAVVSSLRKQGKNELADTVERMNAGALQRSAVHAAKVAAQTNGQTLEEFQGGAKLASRTPQEQLIQQQMAVLRKLAPSVNQDMWSNVMGAITKDNGTFKDVLTAMATSISSSNLNDKQKQELFHSTAVATILDKKYAKQAGLNNDETDFARNALSSLYQAAENDPKTIENLHKLLSNSDDWWKLSLDEQSKARAALDILDKDDQKKLKDVISKAEGKLQEEWDSKKEELVVNRVRDTAEVPITPAGGSGTPTGSGTPAGGSGSGSTPSTGSTATDDRKSALGTPDNPMIVQFKGTQPVFIPAAPTQVT